jgi:hypothetical protein
MTSPMLRRCCAAIARAAINTSSSIEIVVRMASLRSAHQASRIT